MPMTNWDNQINDKLMIMVLRNYFNSSISISLVGFLVNRRTELTTIMCTSVQTIINRLSI